MGKNEEVAPGYYKVELSKEESQKEYDVDEEFLEKAFSHMKMSDVAKFLQKSIIKGTKREKE